MNRLSINTCKLAAVVALATLATGCNTSNFDVRTFDSTVDRPTTVEVVAAMTDGGVIWSNEVPVNHKLRIDFDRKGDWELAKVNPQKAPHVMRWQLFTANGVRKDFGKVDLPGVPVYTRPVYRPAPEWPEDFTPPGSTPEATPIEILETDTPDDDGATDEGGDEGEDSGTTEDAGDPEPSGTTEAPSE